MFSTEDIRTPRDRINEQFMRRLLENEHGYADNCGCTGCNMPQVQQRRNNIPDNPPPCRVPEGQPLAMVYSPCQIWRGVYDPETGLKNGTIFKELNNPWEVKPAIGKGGCGCGK